MFMPPDKPREEPCRDVSKLHHLVLSPADFRAHLRQLLAGQVGRRLRGVGGFFLSWPH